MCNNPTQPLVSDRPHAPIIYFENAPTIGHGNGVISLTLTTSLQIPDSDGTGVAMSNTVVAYLRMNVPGAKLLRDAIDKALLMAEPVESSTQN